MSSSWLVFFAVLVPVIAASLSTGLLLLGRAVGTPLSGYLGVAGSFAALAASLATLVAWLAGGSSWGFGDRPLILAASWLDAPPVHLAMGVQVDSLGVAWLFVVALLWTIVSVFLAAESRRDARSHRQVAAVGFLAAGAALNSIAGSLLLLTASLGSLVAAAWLGASHDAGNRVVARRAAGLALAGASAVALLGVAASICVHHLGGTSLRLLVMQPALPSGGIVSVLVVLGAAVALGLFPFQPWVMRLAFAPSGPRTLAALFPPLSAMLLLLRLDGLLTADAHQLLLILATITLALQSVALPAQRELPRVFLVAVNVGFALAAWLLARRDVAAAAQLTPALAIALAGVGVGIGTVVHVTRGQLALARLGGLIVKLPITGAALALGMLAVSGIPLGGVGEALRARSDDVGWTGWIPALVGAALAFGLTRTWLSSFFGEPRHLRTHARAAEQPLLWGAASAAALFALCSGFDWFPLRFLIEQAPVEAARLAAVEATLPAARATTMAANGPGYPSAPWGWSVGVMLASLAWWRGGRAPGAWSARPSFEWAATVLRDGFFFDDFYRALVGGVGAILADALARLDAWTQRSAGEAASGVARSLSRAAASLDVAVLSAQTAPLAWRGCVVASALLVVVGVVGAAWIRFR